MANIDIQQKRNSALPWILGIIAAIVLIWILVEAFDRDNKVAEATPGAPELTQPGPEGEQQGALGEANGTSNGAMEGAAAEIPEPVNEFTRFVQDTAARQDAGQEHEYASEGIQRLASAIDAIAEREGVMDETFNRQSDSLEANAERLQEKEQITIHSNLVRNSLETAADLIGRIQQAGHPQLEGDVEQVKQAAQAVNPELPLLEQTEEMTMAFEQASRTLQAMASKEPETVRGGME